VNTDARKKVEQAKKGFERDLFAPGYAQIISDEEHLAGLVRLSELRSGKRFLDIGTGSGYVAFELLRRNPEISVAGVDIVEKAVAANNQKAREIENGRIEFLTFDGMRLPFGDGTFYGVISRYAFHHFPQPALSVSEIFRVLEPEGWCIISDPMADPADDCDFVNQFGALKDDGHVRYYLETELVKLFREAGLVVENKFMSAITFPRALDTRYTELVAKTPRRIVETYGIRLEKDSIYMTVQVMNIRLRKPGSIHIRKAEIPDLDAITEIYNEAVLTTTATFDTEPKTVAERLQWFQAHDGRHPVLVAELDGAVVGWASISRWSDRPAYDDTAETSFYVKSGYRGRGVGRRLKQALIEEARRLRFHTLIARVADESEASRHLNESFGFVHIGTMKEVGKKFGRLLDVHILQKMLD
jgi:L-amino acid N-acyltransferase YncA/ubiquinone/menaquinone biosynthesis C-methylase UbiE